MDLKPKDEKKLYLASFVGGGVAGLFVDMVLFPLDTLKTRLQAQQGFTKAGGFKGIYKGIGPQAIGSAPQAALFFLTYETIKHYSEGIVPSYAAPAVHMFGGGVAEVGLYRGFGSTILREIPFSVIQFPILEYLKKTYRKNFKNNIPLESWEVAVCGSIAGGFSAAVTTPLDVAKTRIMLADRKQVRAGEMTVANTLKQIYRTDGVKGLFSGFVPRVTWITLGGCIFFGSYDFAKGTCLQFIDRDIEY
ncbi:mitochondrial S-adenosylmethionine carrier protein isoform X3 [Diabrotica undecimpunctata]|uniref:mitochondrial S-adenosylmethionine carrier protein isoform X3 n=1 Tax=Diabrotica undecimpunctata TaxID=50387 RepID=UPI003B636F14